MWWAGRWLARGRHLAPARPLGRWCTPAYAPTCDPDRKAVLNARDHGVDTPDMRVGRADATGAEEEPSRGARLLWLHLDSYGR